jgi:DNA polymerase-2
MQSKPGIYNFVIVCDFKSLYPSIVRTFNIDPFTFVPENKVKGDLIITHNKAGFKREEGILPEIIQHLWAEREKARKSKNELARYAIKILMNSFYGVLASPNCRFYNYDLTNAITTFGHYILKTSAELIEKQGYEVIYGDTDSIFVNLNVKTEKQAELIGKKIEKVINSHFDKHVKKVHKQNSFLELEFEKTYIRFLMPRARGSEKGAKKRYAGLIKKEGKEKIDFTGMEFVRRDWTDLSKKFQLELLDRIFHKKEIANFVKKFVDNLRKGKYDSLLIYRKALSKELSEYVKTTPPHVKAARLLDKIEDNVIQYLMTENGPEPIQKLKSKLDYEHYIAKQIKPLADSVLCFYSVNFDDLLQGNKQKTLFSY